MPTSGVREALEGDLFLGIDQSYTGFAMTVIDQSGYAWTTCKPLKGKGVNRLKDAQETVGQLCWELQRDLKDVCMEGYAYGAAQTAHMAGELGGAIKLSLDFQKQNPLIATPTQVKKYATGRGNSKKDEMLLAVYKNWSVEFRNDNMADSYVLARIALGEATNEHQRKVISDVRKDREERSK